MSFLTQDIYDDKFSLPFPYSHIALDPWQWHEQGQTTHHIKKRSLGSWKDREMPRVCLEEFLHWPCAICLEHAVELSVLEEWRAWKCRVRWGEEEEVSSELVEGLKSWFLLCHLWVITPNGQYLIFLRRLGKANVHLSFQMRSRTHGSAWVERNTGRQFWPQWLSCMPSPPKKRWRLTLPCKKWYPDSSFHFTFYFCSIKHLLILQLSRQEALDFSGQGTKGQMMLLWKTIFQRVRLQFPFLKLILTGGPKHQ